MGFAALNPGTYADDPPCAARFVDGASILAVFFAHCPFCYLLWAFAVVLPIVVCASRIGRKKNRPGEPEPFFRKRCW